MSSRRPVSVHSDETQTSEGLSVAFRLDPQLPQMYAGMSRARGPMLKMIPRVKNTIPVGGDAIVRVYHNFMNVTSKDSCFYNNHLKQDCPMEKESVHLRHGICPPQKRISN